MRLLLPAALLLSGAAGCSPGLRPDDAAPSAASVVLYVPTEEQEGDSDCGLACLAALLRFHGLDLDDDARRSFPPAASSGVRAGAIRDYLERRGFRAHIVHGTLDDARPAGLLRVLRAGLPALVEIALPDRSASHYVLVTGYDPVHKWLVLMDPAWGQGVVPYDKFDELWAAADRFMLVAAPEASLVRARAQPN